MKKNTARADKTAKAFNEAVDAHQQSDFATARRLYAKVLRARPHHYRALRLSALLASQTGKAEEAIRHLNVAIRHAPDGDPGALEDLGLLYMQTGGQEKAEDVLRRAIEVKPDSLPAWVRLGSTLMSCGRGAEAVDVFRDAQKIGPEDPEVGYGLAHALLEAKQFSEAVAACDETLELRPEDPPVLVVKGVALFEQGEFGQAEPVLAQAVTLDANDLNGWLHLGRTRLKLADHDGALNAFERCVAIAPESQSAQSQLANAHAAAGAPEKAVEVCDRFLADYPGSSALMLVKALALNDAGRLGEAADLTGLDTLVSKRLIDAPGGFATLSDFNGALEEMILGHSSLARNHTNRATRHGIQTGTLILDPAPVMRTLLRVIDTQVREKLRELRNSDLAEHPWIKHAPPRWQINAWAVVLSDQGYQLSHVHPEAWLSGVYYVKVPEDGVGPEHGEDGWIEFGRPSDQLYFSVDPPVMALEPQPGMMVLFPSATFHRTIPFTSEGQRISIAFDVFADTTPQ